MARRAPVRPMTALPPLAAAAAIAGCGATAGPVAVPSHAPRARARSPRPRPVALRLVGARSLPAPVQLPALARAGRAVLAIGGLDARDPSGSDAGRLAPGARRRVGALPAAVHDVAAVGLGARAYAFGGGSSAGPTAAISALSARGTRVRTVGR